MIIIVQGPPASGKTTIAKNISETFSLPHISRDNIREWLSVVGETQDEKIQKFCSHAGYELTFDIAGELSKGRGSFIIEGCFNPELGPIKMKEKLSLEKHEITEIFLTARNDLLVQRYLDRAGTKARHPAHGNEFDRGEELAQHLDKVSYKPMGIGKIVLNYDNSEEFESSTAAILEKLKILLSDKHNSLY